MKKGFVIALIAGVLILAGLITTGILFLPNIIKQLDTGAGNFDLSPEFEFANATGPGGCDSRDSCVSYCSGHVEICQVFCASNPSNEVCSAFSASKNAPCSTEAECITYCQNNMAAEFCQGGPGGMTELVPLSAPFKISDYSPVYWGMWPFCVHGGDHPEGHGGFDIELKDGTQIFASADGTVQMLEDLTPYNENGTGIYVGTNSGIAVDYTCLVNITVKMNDAVTKGQYLGNACELPRGENYIHFGVNDFANEKNQCPTNYLDDDFKALINQMFSQAHYPEQATEPKLCNCDNLPYKPTQTSQN